MADILIRDMEMPISCIACPLNFGEKRPEYGLTIYCQYSNGVISWRSKAFDNGRLASCGIIPLPEGHGNLIDADALIRDKSNEVNLWYDYEYLDYSVVFEEDIKNAPIIIPAEGYSEGDQKTNCSDCDNQNTPVCKYCEHDAEGGGE